jgi:hypothetical protein
MEAIRPFPDPKSPNVYPKHRLPCPRSRRHIAYIIRTDAFKEKEKMKQKEKRERERPVLCPCPLGIYPENVKICPVRKSRLFVCMKWLVAPITFPSCAPGRRQ